jgi:putative restriction endonuclease
VSQLSDSYGGVDLPNQDDSEELFSFEGVNRVALRAVRVGQSFFRNAVLSAYHYRCCITGMAIPQLLVASHIVPWRADTANRLNPRNGLCLSMLHDKAFDIGIICLTDDLTVRVSKRYASDTDPFFRNALLAYDGKPISIPEKFRPNPNFLAYHRAHIFGG